MVSSVRGFQLKLCLRSLAPHFVLRALFVSFFFIDHHNNVNGKVKMTKHICAVLFIALFLSAVRPYSVHEDKPSSWLLRRTVAQAPLKRR